jgi:ubiquinone/menaquinone biosynthesis C-methylase UbiE
MDIRNESYYKIAKEGSLNNIHPSSVLISSYGKNANRILDVGCGEGTRLYLIKNKKAEKIGVDQSETAISMARKQYPLVKFIKIQDKLPFPDSYFDFVYSAFVLEHTIDPEEFLKETVRVLSPGGVLLLVAPNFGSPNRASPNNVASRVVKLLKGVGNDLLLIFTPKINKLNWQHVKPQNKYNEIDADTTVEPYLLSLEKYLAGRGIKKIKSSSLWDQEKGFKLSQIFFRQLLYWGPHILYVGRKYVGKK